MSCIALSDYGVCTSAKFDRAAHERHRTSALRSPLVNEGTISKEQELSCRLGKDI